MLAQYARRDAALRRLGDVVQGLIEPHRPTRLTEITEDDEAMGHVNFGPEVHDRKGLHGPVTLKTAAGDRLEPRAWQVYRLPLDEPMLASLQWKRGKAGGPAFWRGGFDVTEPADTFLDVSTWGKGVLWVNGRCMGRFWNIGPTQTMYVPGPWLKRGRNEVIVLDLLGPQEPALAGLEKPILDQVRPQFDFSRKVQQAVPAIEGVRPVHSGAFAPGPAAQEVRFARPVEGRQFCLETLSAVDGKPFAAVAELDLLGTDGRPIAHTLWTVAYVDSEERIQEDGSALNAINGQTADFWHTEWSQTQPGHPHRLVIDLGKTETIGGFDLSTNTSPLLETTWTSQKYPSRHQTPSCKRPNRYGVESSRSLSPCLPLFLLPHYRSGNAVFQIRAECCQ